jgi:hypothetical protein
VCLRLRLNGSSRWLRYGFPHATAQLHDRTTHSPPSRRQPLAAQSAAGTGKAFRAGQAGRIVANPCPVATACPLTFAVVDRIRRPRRRAARTTPPQGQCSGAADDGGKSGGDHPALGKQVRPPRRAVSAPSPVLSEIRGQPLNLLHPAQTYFCLGHCITRGIGLRRQASILRLSGAALFWLRPQIPAKPGTGRALSIRPP